MADDAPRSGQLVDPGARLDHLVGRDQVGVRRHLGQAAHDGDGGLAVEEDFLDVVGAIELVHPDLAFRELRVPVASEARGRSGDSPGTSDRESGRCGGDPRGASGRRRRNRPGRSPASGSRSSAASTRKNGPKTEFMAAKAAAIPHEVRRKSAAVHAEAARVKGSRSRAEDARPGAARESGAADRIPRWKRCGSGPAGAGRGSRRRRTCAPSRRGRREAAGRERSCHWA